MKRKREEVDSKHQKRRKIVEYFIEEEEDEGEDDSDGEVEEKEEKQKEIDEELEKRRENDKEEIFEEIEDSVKNFARIFVRYLNPFLENAANEFKFTRKSPSKFHILFVFLQTFEEIFKSKIEEIQNKGNSEFVFDLCKIPIGFFVELLTKHFGKVVVEEKDFLQNFILVNEAEKLGKFCTNPYYVTTVKGVKIEYYSLIVGEEVKSFDETRKNKIYAQIYEFIKTINGEVGVEPNILMLEYFNKILRKIKSNKQVNLEFAKDSVKFYSKFFVRVVDNFRRVVVLGELDEFYLVCGYFSYDVVLIAKDRVSTLKFREEVDFHMVNRFEDVYKFSHLYDDILKEITDLSILLKLLKLFDEPSIQKIRKIPKNGNNFMKKEKMLLKTIDISPYPEKEKVLIIYALSVILGRSPSKIEEFYNELAFQKNQSGKVEGLVNINQPMFLTMLKVIFKNIHIYQNNFFLYELEVHTGESKYVYQIDSININSKRLIPLINEYDFIPYSNIRYIEENKIHESLSGINFLDFQENCSTLEFINGENRKKYDECQCLKLNSIVFYDENGVLKSPNESETIFECGHYCLCTESRTKCKNKVCQSNPYLKLVIFKKAKTEMGFSIRIRENVKRGQFICEYVGEIIHEKEARRRQKLYEIERRVYLFDLVPGYLDPTVITNQGVSHANVFSLDAYKNGNFARFINHSCTPNLICRSFCEGSKAEQICRVAIFAARDIYMDEEISFHYRYDLGDKKTGIIPCLCGAQNCRKWLM